MISLTKDAESKVNLLFKTEQRTHEDFLRIKVIGGGCSGFMYDLSFESDRDVRDKVVNSVDLIDIIVDSRSLLYLAGSELAYEGGLNGTGFIINNPNANSTCGCGESFSI